MSRPALGEPGYQAFLAHRLSGVALALFLPLHFLTLGLAIEGEARLQQALTWFEQPLVKFAEWGLLVMLTLHLALGVRLLLLELGAWSGHRVALIGIGAALAALVGTAFWILA